MGLCQYLRCVNKCNVKFWQSKYKGRWNFSTESVMDLGSSRRSSVKDHTFLGERLFLKERWRIASN